MLTAALALALVSGASPDTIEVLLSRSIDTTPERAQDVVDRAAAAVTAVNVGPVGSPQTARVKLLSNGAGAPEACNAKKPCLEKLGQALGAGMIVAVDVGHVGDQMAIGLDALVVADGKSLASHRFTIDTAGYPAGMDKELQTFVGKLHKSVKGSDAPVVATGTSPSLTPTGGTATATPSTPFTLPPTKVLAAGGGAAAFGVATVVLAALGSGAKGQLDAAKYTSGTNSASHLTAPEAKALASTANGEFTAALGCGVATAALAGLATWWWMHPEESR